MKKIIKSFIKFGYYRKTIYKKKYRCFSKWNNEIKSYIKIEKVYGFKQFIYYIVSVPNVSKANKNLIKALYDIIEYESIGMSKYNSLKEKIYYSKNSKEIINLMEEGNINEKY